MNAKAEEAAVHGDSVWLRMESLVLVLRFCCSAESHESIGECYRNGWIDVSISSKTSSDDHRLAH